MNIFCTNNVKIVILFLLVNIVTARKYWEEIGCYLVGSTISFEMDGCPEYIVQTNACLGYCTSMSIPASESDREVRPDVYITTYGSCCAMVKFELATRNVTCLTGIKEITFASATECQCIDCNDHVHMPEEIEDNEARKELKQIEQFGGRNGIFRKKKWMPSISRHQALRPTKRPNMINREMLWP